MLNIINHCILQAVSVDAVGVYSTIVLTVVVLIFGEVTPKTLAKEMPETIATAVSPVLSLLLTLFTPLTWLFSQWKKLLGRFVHSSESDAITEGELITMVSEAENDGELTDRESQLIRSAIEFDDVEVEEILTPRVDVVAVEDDISLEELAQTFAESGYSRLPVYHDTVDNIIGVVHEKDFYIARLKKSVTMEDLIAPTLYTTGSTQISQLLRTLREITVERGAFVKLLGVLLCRAVAHAEQPRCVAVDAHVPVGDEARDLGRDKAQRVLGVTGNIFMAALFCERRGAGVVPLAGVAA